jgi:hypothetical protein
MDISQTFLLVLFVLLLGFGLLVFVYFQGGVSSAVPALWLPPLAGGL